MLDTTRLLLGIDSDHGELNFDNGKPIPMMENLVPMMETSSPMTELSTPGKSFTMPDARSYLGWRTSLNLLPAYCTTPYWRGFRSGLLGGWAVGFLVTQLRSEV